MVMRPAILTYSTSSLTATHSEPSLQPDFHGFTDLNTIESSARLSPNFGKNQHLPIDNEIKDRLKRLLINFHAPIRYVFAYGSGVFPQKGYDSKSGRPMVDFIFAINHPQHWHSLNINQHRNHYSFMGTLGSRAVTVLQENVGAGIYFNPYVNMDGMLIKYGIVTVDTLCKDLLNWETLYMAGRMHKPVKILKDDARVRLAQQVNLVNALRTALLLLPKDFTEEELYLMIASISFKGDFRRFIGENPNKIKNMVSKQMNHFNLLYGRLIQGLPNVEFVGNGILQQDNNPKAHAQMLEKLPNSLKYKIQEEYRLRLVRKGEPYPSDEKMIYKNIASSDECIKYINAGLRDITFKPALTQSIKGILTAGFIKSGKYIANKTGKWLLRPQ